MKEKLALMNAIRKLALIRQIVLDERHSALGCQTCGVGPAILGIVEGEEPPTDGEKRYAVVEHELGDDPIVAIILVGASEGRTYAQWVEPSEIASAAADDPKGLFHMRCSVLETIMGLTLTARDRLKAEHRLLFGDGEGGVQ